MSTTADSRLPASAAPPPRPDAENGGEAAPPDVVRAHRRRRQGRSLAWGIGISIVVHLLILLFAARTWIPVRKSDTTGASNRSATRALPEMQVLNIRITSETTSPEPEAERPSATIPERVPPRRTPTPVMEPVEPTPAPVEKSGAGAEATSRDRRSAAERLRPEYVDPRLWERPEAPPEPVKSDVEIARERVYARINALNDSLAAVGEAARRATDWTFTDKDGRRWGFSPGKVHLGGVTLPLPINLSAPPDKAREARDRAGKAGEIDRQADGARIRETFEEQVKTTREQRDRARSEAKRDTTRAGGSD